MSILKITDNDVETFTVVANPTRTYVSSSSGVTGSLYVYARRSLREKDVNSTSAYVDAAYADDEFDKLLRQVQLDGGAARYYASSSSDQAEKYAQDQKFHGSITALLDKVDSKQPSLRKRRVLDVKRIVPSVTFSSATLKKLLIKDVLNSYYRTSHSSAHWAFTNYNSLNFFTASTVPAASALLYPNVVHEDTLIVDGHVSGTYCLSGAFSFDFYINPKYKQSKPDTHYRPGTIFHLSSSYCLSLASGTLKDQNGRSAGFRLQLQLSHSADVSPSLTIPGGYPNDLTFFSDDNSLLWNKWHHVIVRWGTDQINNGTGSFVIDGVEKGNFVVPSGTIMPRVFDSNSNVVEPAVLVIGNYWNGPNSTTSNQQMFFAHDVATREGLEKLDTTTGIVEPGSYYFDHPLNAEVHDLSIKRYYVTDRDIATSGSVGPSYLDDSYAFYLPPFFVEDSPYRQSVDGSGGVLQTPYYEADGITDFPINVAMSFGVNGHYVNLENYVRDFANDAYPRLHRMSASVLSYDPVATNANEVLYSNQNVVRRNLLVLPCDDGRFIPSFQLLSSESQRRRYVGDDGVEDLSYVSLDNLLSTSSIVFGATFEDVDGESAVSSQDFINQAIGFTPERPGVDPGPAYLTYVTLLSGSVVSSSYDLSLNSDAPLVVYQRTLDPSSNHVTIFDVSNLYYGNRILPKSVVISDSSFTGSSGAMTVTIKDDGWGNLYRCDSLTSASTWNSCGNVYYSEGLLLIKNPHLQFFGKEQFSLTFKGERGVHVLRFDVVARSNTLNSSSNPCYKDVNASGYPTDSDPKYVYVSGINFHDDNYNIVAKAQLAQPALKRHGDRILFRVPIDY